MSTQKTQRGPKILERNPSWELNQRALIEAFFLWPNRVYVCICEDERECKNLYYSNNNNAVSFLDTFPSD